MAKKIRYRVTSVHQIAASELVEAFQSQERVVVGIDVAKRKFAASLCDGAGDVQRLLGFEHPSDTRAFVERLVALKAAGKAVEVALEPTGTYGDPLRYLLDAAEIPVFRVNNKQVHDAAELFDGSHTKHDNKDACLIAWLHAHDRSKLWPVLSAQRREVRALTSQREVFDAPLRQQLARMEPLLAKHFPELEASFDLYRRKTPYRLMAHFGSPSAMAQAGYEELAQQWHQSARKPPKPDKVKALLQAASGTTGVAPTDNEIELIRIMCREILRLMQLRDEVDKRIEEAAKAVACCQAMRPRLGIVTSVVIYAFMGDPSHYQSASAFEKAVGLNLVEKSSGEHAGQRRISKRGPAIVRKYLFLAAMRLVKDDPLVRAWYRKRRSYTDADGGKLRALVAVVRKLCRALHHVARGEPFATEKLFDTRALKGPLPEVA